MIFFFSVVLGNMGNLGIYQDYMNVEWKFTNTDLYRILEMKSGQSRLESNFTRECDKS